MALFYLISIVLGISSQNVFKKAFSQKDAGNGVYTFALLCSLSSMLFFIMSSRDLQWNPGLIVYAVFFGISFGAATIFSTLSMSHGPLSLTALVNSFSLMIPTFYGLLFLKEPVGIGLIPGLGLLAASLVLINKKSHGSPVTAKWFLYVLISFTGNGMCSVVQKMQQNAFSGAYKNEFMILSLGIVSGIMAVAVAVTERKASIHYAASCWYLALFCGIMNGMVNLFVMVLSGMMPVSLMFPLMSVGGIVVTFFISKFFYKEQLTKAQYIGFLLGTASIVLLNIS